MGGETDEVNPLTKVIVEALEKSMSEYWDDRLEAIDQTVEILDKLRQDIQDLSRKVDKLK